MYFRLFTLPQKKTICYGLTHHTWKMLPHYLAKCRTFSSDWRYVAFLQTLVALKKNRLWAGIGGSKENRLWCVANGMSGKQMFKMTTFCTDTCFQSLPLLINCIVHHAVLKFSPCRNASATRPYRGLVLETREKKWKKDEKFMHFTR